MQLSMAEAKLFRVLTDIFGHDHVIPKMRVSALLPLGVPESQQRSGIDAWVKANQCLFTVVNHDDSPTLVVEFYNGFNDSIDPREEEHQRILPGLLAAAGIPYLTVSFEEFEEALAPDSEIKFPDLLRLKLEEICEQGAF